MRKTYNFPVDNIGAPENVVAQTSASRIRIRERRATKPLNYFAVYVPNKADSPAGSIYPPGEACTFDAPQAFGGGGTFKAGSTIAQVETVIGDDNPYPSATTFDQEEL